jgi:hypothetical protein
MKTNISDLTITKLKNLLTLKEQIEALQSQLDSIAGGDGEIPSPGKAPKKRRRRMSRAGRAAIAAAQRARWAKVKGKGRAKSKLPKKKRKVSMVVKRKLAAIAKARWAKVKAEGKKAL